MDLQVGQLNAQNGEGNATRNGKTEKACLPRPQTFDESHVGIQALYKLPVDAKKVEYFKLYFDGELLGDIKMELIDTYADQTKSIKDWVATTTEELAICLFAIVILMGVVKNR